MTEIKENILLAPYTTFKIGGPAKYFSEAKNTEEILELCDWANKNRVPIFVLAGGSNVLIFDKGFNGLVIKIKNCKLEIENFSAKVEAGVSLAKLVSESIKTELSGLEWAMGIPGTIGGAINGNSGAFNKSMSDVVKEVEVLDIRTGSVQKFRKDDCKFGYRKSVFKNNFDLITLSAVLELNKGGKEEIQKIIQEHTSQRVKSVPSGYSAGCFFKNVEWGRAGNKKEIIRKFPELSQFENKPKISIGFLTEYLGLKGKAVGEAEVSEKHAGFIINRGGAAAEDVLDLAGLIKEKIRERYGFDLEEEVVIVK